MLVVDRLLVVVPGVGGVPDRKDRVAHDGDTGRDRLRPGAVAVAQRVFRPVGVAQATQPVDDDRLVVPVGFRRLRFRQGRRGRQRHASRQHRPSVDPHACLPAATAG